MSGWQELPNPRTERGVAAADAPDHGLIAAACQQIFWKRVRQRVGRSFEGEEGRIGGSRTLEGRKGIRSAKPPEPPHHVGLFDSIAAQRGGGSVVLPFPIWREAFINDADLETAKRAYDVLNPHPVKTFTDKISLKTNPADIGMRWLALGRRSGHLQVEARRRAQLPHRSRRCRRVQRGW